MLCCRFFEMTYIYEKGTVKYNFSNAKQILEIFQLLCAEKDEPYEELCKLFQEETQQGKDTETYSKLLQSAMTSIKESFAGRVMENLKSSRSALLIPSPSEDGEQSEFELLTWLIIK